MHEHFDADGRRCRAADAFLTVVTREPEWDEETSERAMALGRHEASICPCGCGQPIDEAADPTRAFVVQKHVCYARRAIERYRDKAEADAERQNLPDGWNDGHTYVIDDSFVPEPKGGAKRGN